MTPDHAIKLLEAAGLAAQVKNREDDAFSIQGHLALSAEELKRLGIGPNTTVGDFSIFQKEQNWQVVTEIGDFDDFPFPAENFEDAVAIAIALFDHSFHLGQDASISIEDALKKLETCVPKVFTRTSKDGSLQIEGGVPTDKYNMLRMFGISARGAMYTVVISRYPDEVKREIWGTKTLLDAVNIVCKHWR